MVDLPAISTYLPRAQSRALFFFLRYSWVSLLTILIAVAITVIAVYY